MPSVADMQMIDILIEAEGWPGRAELESLTTAAIDSARQELASVQNGSLCLLFTSDAYIQTLNQDFRQKNRPTNVLSFPALSDFADQLGDIALAQETVFREAQEKGIPFNDHIAHLVVHGFLHLQGYDHQTENDANTMESIERRALARLDIADPYAETQ